MERNAIERAALGGCRTQFFGSHLRFLVIDQTIHFNVRRRRKLLARQQMLDELPLVVDPVLEFAVLTPEFLGSRRDPFDGPLQSRRLGQVETDFLSLRLGLRDSLLEPLATTPQAVQAFFFLIYS